MKIIFSLLIVFVLFVSVTANGQMKGYVNPAAVYCEKMGCTYEIRKDEKGNSKGICILPNDSVVDAWDFYKGKVGREYSYCAKKGYSTEYVLTDSGGFRTECAVCVQKLIKGGQTRISMTDLMEKNGEPLITIPEKKSANLIYEKASPGGNLKEAVSIPNAFDWRDYNGHTYIGGVRDQGGCGSCYSFGANASAEGTYNFKNDLYDASCVDLSESFIIWCLGSISPYSDHFSGCAGADYSYMELQALCDSGVCYESSFPYVESNPGSCTHWYDERVKMENWYRVDCTDTTAIKTAIMTYGVVDAAVNVKGGFSGYTGGVYSDGQTTCSGTPCSYTTTNHAISLVGWGHDAVKGLYWILRNSWGSTWGEEGYMRIKWNASRVSCEVCYFESTLADLNNPTSFSASAVSPSQIDLSWNLNANNDPVLLAWSSTGTFGTPVNGYTYSAGNSIPGGGTVLYYGTSTSFNHTPLSPATIYYYKAWSNVSGIYSTGTVKNATTRCNAVSSFPWNEGFENGGSIPDCWAQEQVSGSGINWTFITGNGESNPSVAHSGTYNACLKDASSDDNKTRLITPPIDLSSVSNSTLTFWHTQALWVSDQDVLTLYYKTSAGGSWIELATYTSNIPGWTQDTISLPNGSSDYYINFEGNAKWGYGICLDDVEINGTSIVPPNLALTDSTVSSGESACFDATDTITVAGNGSTVEFLSGSTVDLIAGMSISFLPGFHACEGNITNASITTEALFCDSRTAGTVVSQRNEKSKTVREITIPTKISEKSVKVYPNPNSGRFTLELTNFEGLSQVYIMNILGTMFYQTTVNSIELTELDLATLRKGLYFICVKNGDLVKTNKIIIQ
jgi:C1A family cysteine protease/putative hemolysin